LILDVNSPIENLIAFIFQVALTKMSREVANAAFAVFFASDFRSRFLDRLKASEWVKECSICRNLAFWIGVSFALEPLQLHET